MNNYLLLPIGPKIGMQHENNNSNKDYNQSKLVSITWTSSLLIAGLAGWF